MEKKFYVIGNNTKKSLSPDIFKYWFNKYKISASYCYLELEEEEFEKKNKKIASRQKYMRLQYNNSI